MYVHLYSEYSENQAYGEKITHVFEKEEDATRLLKNTVERYFDMTWDELVKESGKTDHLEVREDFVRFNDGKDEHYWLTETHKVRKCLFLSA